MIPKVLHYTQLPIPERVDAALKSCKDSGIVSRDKAISMIALSGREADYCIVRDRATKDGLRYIKECRGRTSLGLETLGRVVWPMSLQTNAAALARARQLGIASNDAPPGVKIIGNAKKVDSEEVASLFEWAIARKDGSFLECFSLGPGQMWLHDSALCPAAGSNKWGWKVRCGWVHTWDEIWRLYAALSAWDAINRDHHMDPGNRNSSCNPKSGVPAYIKWPAAPGGGSESNCVAWLSAHAGSGSAAYDYYHGNDISDKSKAYKNMLAFVMQRAAAIW